jgi:hypothetical protein
MASLTNAGEFLVLQFAVNAAATLGLFTEDPTEAGLLTAEVTSVGTGYVRQPISFAAPNTDGNGVTSAKNDTSILFPVATAPWGSITHVGIFSTDEEMIWYGPLAVSRLVLTDDQLRFPIDSIVVQMS